MTGLLGFSSGYKAMMSCDTLLMLGTDFPYQQFYPKSARIVQVDIREEQLGRRSRVDLGVVGGAAETLRALTPAIVSATPNCFSGPNIQPVINGAAAPASWETVLR